MIWIPDKSRTPIVFVPNDSHLPTLLILFSNRLKSHWHLVPFILCYRNPNWSLGRWWWSYGGSSGQGEHHKDHHQWRVQGKMLWESSLGRLQEHYQGIVLLRWLKNFNKTVLQWGARIPNIGIMKTFEYWTFWSSDLQWLGFGMVGYSNISSYDPDHSKTKPLEIQTK